MKNITYQKYAFISSAKATIQKNFTVNHRASRPFKFAWSCPGAVLKKYRRTRFKVRHYCHFINKNAV